MWGIVQSEEKSYRLYADVGFEQSNESVSYGKLHALVWAGVEDERSPHHEHGIRMFC